MQNKLRIFSLNTEYGKYSSTFLPYLETIKENFDVFCFQEVPNNAKNTICFEEGYDAHLYGKLIEVLKDFTPYYSEYVEESFGIATFVRTSLKQKYRGEKYLFGFREHPFLDKDRWNNSTKLLALKVDGINIINLHGAWQPKSKKEDTSERLIQSRILRRFTKGKEPKTLLIGDFNLNPKTKSIEILEKKYLNLIREYKIPSTRTAVYNDASLPFADYAFVGEKILVQDFQVLLNPIFSDHGFMTLTLSKN